ncbi:MAG: histidine phosphatase family protein [Planctomycetes bacterium]|nr:histidine phosphatase family protein [Planctomycetota bacterium]
MSREKIVKTRCCLLWMVIGVVLSIVAAAQGAVAQGVVAQGVVAQTAVEQPTSAQDAAARQDASAQDKDAQAAEARSARLAPATFFLVRHADRDGKKDALTEAGLRRAHALRDFLLKQRVRAIYSTDTNRTMGTAQPTATAAKLEIVHYRPLPTPPKEWFAAIAKKHAGESILIVGHSNTVVPFVRALGGKTDFEFTEDDYCPMFIVSSNGSEGQAVRINYGEVPPARQPAKREARRNEPAGRGQPVKKNEPAERSKALERK